MVVGIWGQTRSYGDTYHWPFHDGTVESVSAVPVFFSGGVSRGQGTKSKQIFSQPGGAEISDQRANAPRLWASSDLVPAPPGWEICGLQETRAPPKETENTLQCVGIRLGGMPPSHKAGQ